MGTMEFKPAYTFMYNPSGMTEAELAERYERWNKLVSTGRLVDLLKLKKEYAKIQPSLVVGQINPTCEVSVQWTGELLILCYHGDNRPTHRGNRIDMVSLGEGAATFKVVSSTGNQYEVKYEPYFDPVNYSRFGADLWFEVFSNIPVRKKHMGKGKKLFPRNCFQLRLELVALVYMAIDSHKHQRNDRMIRTCRRVIGMLNDINVKHALDNDDMLKLLTLFEEAGGQAEAFKTTDDNKLFKVVSDISRIISASSQVS